MSARSHGTGEPGPGEPDETSAADLPRADDEPGSGDPPATGEPVEGAPARASSDAGGTDADLEPDDVEARWADIVTRLQGPADPRAWSPDPEVEDAEDHFVPPEAEPVLGGDPLLTMAWAAVIGVPLLVVVLAVAWRDAPTWLLQVAGATFLAGAGLLVWRMPHERDDDAGPGAVV